MKTIVMSLLLAGALSAQSKETKECSAQAEKYASRKRQEGYNTELLKSHYNKKEDVCFAYTVHSLDADTETKLHTFVWDLVDAYEGSIWAYRLQTGADEKNMTCHISGEKKDCKFVEDFISHLLNE